MLASVNRAYVPFLPLHSRTAHALNLLDVIGQAYMILKMRKRGLYEYS